MMRLNDLMPNPGANKKKQRVGRGRSSGMGKTCTRGHKGQGSRAGVALGAFEGGQNPLYTRLPKRGFVNIGRIPRQVINFSRIYALIESKSLEVTPDFVVDLAFLLKHALIRRGSSVVRLLSDGEVMFPLTFALPSASRAALAKIEAAGAVFRSQNSTI